MTTSNNVRGAVRRYQEVDPSIDYNEQDWKEADEDEKAIQEEFKDEEKHLRIEDSIRDLELEPCDGGDQHMVEDEGMTNIEPRKASELGQEVRSESGLPREPLHPHPDGHKVDGPDGEDHKYGKSYSRFERPVVSRQIGELHMVQQITPAPRIRDDSMVEVYFGFRGKYERVLIPENATQEEVERQAQMRYQGCVGLIDLPLPSEDISYKFKAMYCRDRENAAWIRCDRTDTVDEEWILFGQEISDLETTKVMEERWITPLKITKPSRPLENNQAIHFTRRAPDEDEEDEEGVSIMPLEAPLGLFRDLSNWKPPRPSTPVHFTNFGPGQRIRPSVYTA
jgi:hypothetical protein